MAAKAAIKEEAIEIPSGELLTSAHERQQREQHYWIEFHQMEDDAVDSVHIGAAGVSYNVRKGQRVPLPQSAINALNMAVQELHEPVIVNERRYLRHTKRHRFPFTISGPCSPEEAKRWKQNQARSQTAALTPVDDLNDGMQLRDEPDTDDEGGRLERLPE